MNEDFNLLALISAGNITEDDNTLGLIQHINRDHAHSICKWLVLATGKPAKLRLIGFAGDEEIAYTPEQVQAGIKKQIVQVADYFNGTRDMNDKISKGLPKSKP